MNRAQITSPEMMSRAAFGLFGIAVPLLGGCVHETYLTQTGSLSDPSPLKEIQIGTSADFLRKKLGPPDSIEKFGDDALLWKYTFNEHRESTCSFLFILYSGGKEETRTCSAVFEIRDEKVVAGPEKNK